MIFCEKPVPTFSFHALAGDQRLCRVGQYLNRGRYRCGRGDCAYVLTDTGNSARSFGKFTVSTGGTVAISAACVGSITCNINVAPRSAVSADAFTVTGDNVRNFSLVATNSTKAAGARTIATTTPMAPTGTTSAAGTAAFKVGGTLTLIGTETPGNCAGTYNATMTCN